MNTGYKSKRGVDWIMAFTFNPLWKTLIDRNMTKEDLRLGIKTSPSTIAKMGKNEYVSLDVIDRICNYLDCEISDVIEHVKD